MPGMYSLARYDVFRRRRGYVLRAVSDLRGRLTILVVMSGFAARALPSENRHHDHGVRGHIVVLSWNTGGRHISLINLMRMFAVELWIVDERTVSESMRVFETQN